MHWHACGCESQGTYFRVLNVLELTVPQYRAHMRAAEGGPCPRHSSRVPGRDQRSFLPPVAPLQPPLRPHQAPV